MPYKHETFFHNNISFFKFYVPIVVFGLFKGLLPDFRQFSIKLTARYAMVHPHTTL